MHRYIAKERVGLAQDGKTLVAFDSPEANSFFAGKGAELTEAQVHGKENVSKFFTREGTANGGGEKTHEAPASKERVVPAPSEPHTKPPAVKKGR